MGSKAGQSLQSTDSQLILRSSMCRRRGDARTYLPCPCQALLTLSLSAGLHPATPLQLALACAERKSLSVRHTSRTQLQRHLQLHSSSQALQRLPACRLM